MMSLFSPHIPPFPFPRGPTPTFPLLPILLFSPFHCLSSYPCPFLSTFPPLLPPSSLHLPLPSHNLPTTPPLTLSHFLYSIFQRLPCLSPSLLPPTNCPTSQPFLSIPSNLLLSPTTSTPSFLLPSLSYSLFPSSTHLSSSSPLFPSSHPFPFPSYFFLFSDPSHTTTSLPTPLPGFSPHLFPFLPFHIFCPLTSSLISWPMPLHYYS